MGTDRSGAGAGKAKVLAIAAMVVVGIAALVGAGRLLIQGFDSTVAAPGSEAPAAGGDAGAQGGAAPAGVPYNPAYPPRTGRIIDLSQMPAFEGLAATPVSLQLRGVDVEAALSAFGGAIGIGSVADQPVFFRSKSVPPMDMSLDNAPLLEGLLQLCVRSGGHVSVLTRQKINLSATMPDANRVGVWCVAGPFATVLRSIEQEAGLDTPGMPARSGRIGMTLLVEPKVQVASFPATIAIETFQDERGQSLAPAGPQTLGVGQMNQQGLVKMADFQCVLPEAHGRKLAVFKGWLPYVVMDKSEQIPLPLEQGQKRTAECGIVIETVSSQQREPGPLELTVSISRGTLAAEKWQEIAKALPTVVPEGSAGGRPLTVWVHREGTPTGDAMRMRYTVISGNDRPEGLTIPLPTALREVRVPFEFRDLVLP
jgi:hypothetical protein